MRNYVQKGDYITVAAPYALSSGGGALVGSLFGVAAEDAANGATADLATCGVFSLAKTVGQSFAVGAPVYWDNGTKSVTAVTTGNTRIGVAVVATVGGDATAIVRLNGSF
jgi:predicted RecA/RadA family phage recombinase